MMDKWIRITSLITGVIMLVGCSHLTPVAPETPICSTTSTEGHVLWGLYQLYIDPAGPTVDVVPLRQASKHFNVKPYVTPPACNDCILIQPTGPYQYNILPLDITLKNPTAIKGYDVRGILISDDPDVTLKNPDEYTSLFDNGGAVTINPFIAYAKVMPTRSFGPGLSYTEHYNIYLSKFGKVSTVSYAIDASWPGRAKEPYQINQPSVNGIIDHMGKYTADITVDVFAAGNDVDEVQFDCSSMGFTSELPLTYQSGNTWIIHFQNTAHAYWGEYKCMVRASTASSTDSLYDYFSLTVVPTPTSLHDDLQPIFNTYCILCHKQPGPPVGLDLTEGNTYSNIVNVASVQSVIIRVTPFDAFFNSYLFAKVEGVYPFDPFYGSGDRMPKNGPPYLNTDEVSILINWINEGALDN